MVSRDELVSALQPLLPNVERGTIEALAATLDAILSGQAVITDDATVAEREVATALRELVRRQEPVEISSAVIRFGANSQTGDVTVRDVAGRDITNIHIEVKLSVPPATPAQPAPAEAMGASAPPAASAALPTAPAESTATPTTAIAATPTEQAPPRTKQTTRPSLEERWEAFKKRPWVFAIGLLVGLILTITTLTSGVVGTVADWQSIQPTASPAVLAAVATATLAIPTAAPPSATPEPTETLEPTAIPAPTATAGPTPTLAADISCPLTERVKPIDCSIIGPYAWPAADNPDDVPTIKRDWVFRTGQSAPGEEYVLAELRYNLEKPGTYAGIAFTFQRDWEDLSGFEAIQVRLGFPGELDICRLYLKPAENNRPELENDSNPPPDGDIAMGRDLGFKEGIVADPIGPVRTITIPLRTIFPNTPLDRIKEIGFIAGLRDTRPAEGLCRVHDIVLLRTMP